TIFTRPKGLGSDLRRYPIVKRALTERSCNERSPERSMAFDRTRAKGEKPHMKKADLVDVVVAQQKNIPRPQVEATIDSLIEAVAEGLARGERIDLRGFGAFAVRDSAARTGRNPQT